MDRGNFERDQIAHEAEDVWTPPTAFFAREDQEFDGLGYDQFRVLRVLVCDAAVNRHTIVRGRSRPLRAVGVNGADHVHVANHGQAASERQPADIHVQLAQVMRRHGPDQLET